MKESNPQLPEYGAERTSQILAQNPYLSPLDQRTAVSLLQGRISVSVIRHSSAWPAARAAADYASRRCEANESFATQSGD
jgi:hypothetical protein